jgi:hypothetical protein
MQPSAAQIGQRVSIRMFEDSGGFRDILGVLESENTVRKKMAHLSALILQRLLFGRL